MMIHALLHRRFSPARRLPGLLALGLLGLFAGQSPAASAPAAIAGDRLLEVEHGEAGWRLQISELETLAPIAAEPLPLPADHRIHVHRLLATDGGWMLTATGRRGHEGRLIVLKADAAGVDTLPSPATSGRVLLQPTPLATGGEPAAVLWIEGPSPRESSVRAARWSGAGWSAPELISPPGPGTQIALDALRLDDGSLLAVWAAFDGDDDEIVWSRSAAPGEWSSPRPLSANEVPDVTPALAATPGGALVAWSAYDGNDYRVFLCRFDGEGWGAAYRHGERGSVFPSFAPAPGQPVLVYKQTAPAAWRVSSVKADGSQDRTLSLEPGAVRPLVIDADQTGVTTRSAAAEKRAVEVAWQPRR